MLVRRGTAALPAALSLMGSACTQPSERGLCAYKLASNMGCFIDNESLRPVWDCAFPWFVCFYLIDRRGWRDARFKPHLMRVHDPGAIPVAQPSKSTLPLSEQTLFLWIFALAARVRALRRLCTPCRGTQGSISRDRNLNQSRGHASTNPACSIQRCGAI